MTWTDYPGGSVRHDSAKVGEFCIDGRMEWWGYGAGWRHRSDVPVIGPFNSRHEAKSAMDSQRKRVNRRGTVDCLKLNAGCRVRVEREVRRWKRK